jgi:hypothetical protein
MKTVTLSQGLKPIDLMGFSGTTEAVPFYKNMNDHLSGGRHEQRSKTAQSA